MNVVKRPGWTKRVGLFMMVGCLSLALSACGGDPEVNDTADAGEQDDAVEGGEETEPEATEDSQEEASFSGPVSIRINWIPGGQHAFLYYGVQEGYFEEEGIDLEILEGKGSQLAIDDVSAGNADVAMAGTGPAILGMGQGREIVSVGMPIGAGTYGFFVDESVAADGIEDLAGLEVLATPGSPETPLIPPVLDLAGISEAEVNMVNVEAASKLSSYVSGIGDAMATTIPFYNAHVQGARPSDTFLFSDLGLVLPDYSFLVQRETLENQPEMVAAFLRASMRSLAAAMADPEAAVQALADARPDETQFDLELQSWNDFLDFICSDAQEGELLGRHAESDWEQAVDVLKEYAELDAGVVAADLYTNEFFEGDDPVTDETC